MMTSDTELFAYTLTRLIEKARASGSSINMQEIARRMIQLEAANISPSDGYDDLVLCADISTLLGTDRLALHPTMKSSNVGL
jgi:hypothetical protein